MRIMEAEQRELFFTSPQEWHDWLEAHHTQESEK